ncbi:MAG: hypothetical protein HEP71_03975 [Roseivirga sp.]|nr:hypothetical protein [Roseivirga sp.]
MTSSDFFIGDWKVSPALKRISLGAESKTLEPQLMAVLVYLASRPKEVVTKEELMEEVWKGVVVGENVLTRAISSLRKSLGDSRSQPRYIETISKTGYRLIATVNRDAVKKKDDRHIEIKLKRKPVVLVALACSLVIMGAFAMREIFLPIPAEVVYNPVALASDNTTEYYPAISPDGQFAAYATKSDDEGGWDVYAKRIGTETLIRLTDQPAAEMRAVWSPDGNEVYFMRYEAGQSNIYKVPMTGGTEARVLGPGPFAFGNFDISPQGNEIAFNTRKERGRPLQVELTSLVDESRKLMTSPPKGYNGDIHPTYSPDGSQLAFIRERNSVSMYLYVLDLNTGKERQITTEHQSINGFDWSADGSSLIFGSDRTGVYKLWRANLSTGKLKLLPVTDYQMVMPRVAGNDRLIYAKMQDDVNIWAYSLEKNESKAWRSTSELDLNPSYSPDGSKVAFTTNRNGTFQLWTSNSDGSEATAISDFQGEYINTPRWSPDGTEIIFQGYMNGQADLFRINAQGGIAENMTGSDFEEHTPVYSADGESVFYSSNRSGDWQIWRMNSEGGGSKQITSSGGYAPQPGSSDQRIFYVKKDQRGVWSLNLSDGTEVLEIEWFDQKNYGAFSVTENGIFFLNTPNRTLDFVDFEQRKHESLTRTRRIPRMGIMLSHSPTNGTLLFSQVDHSNADIMMLVEQ